MQSLSNRLILYLYDGVSFDTMDQHTRQALEVYLHFKCSALTDLPPNEIKAEIDKMPEAVRGLIKDKARQLYKVRLL